MLSVASRAIFLALQFLFCPCLCLSSLESLGEAERSPTTHTDINDGPGSLLQVNSTKEVDRSIYFNKASHTFDAFSLIFGGLWGVEFVVVSTSLREFATDSKP